LPILPDSAEKSAPEDAGFRRLVESAPDGIVISRDGVVLYANPAAVTLLGYDGASEMVGRSMGVFLDQAALTTMRMRLTRMRTTGESLPPFEYSALRRDGSAITVEISSIFIEFEGAPAVLAFARDTTERSRLRAQLAHADRLASLGVLAAGVAHEINNPLAFVMLAADLLGREVGTGPASETSRELVSNIRAGVERVAAIVRDLRSFGRYEDEPPGPVDLARVFETAIGITAHEVRPRAHLRREHGVLPAVLGVSTRLEQVFVNLLLNAAYAIGEERADGEIIISATVRDVDVVVAIIDNGSGIPAELLPRIFEPFVTTRRGSTGVGLGLSICRDIVARWGGQIEATSELGQGATLRVTLPLASQRPKVEALVRRAEAQIEPGPPLPPPLPEDVEPPSHVQTVVRQRVLVIDDEPLTVAMAMTALRDFHDVVGAIDPTVGLTHILTDPTFDVILCDLMMPGLTGMDLYEKVAEAHPGIERRFVFITGGAYTERARTFLDSVPNRTLTKPLSIAKLEALFRGARPVD
jgi:PAS domain S-box-containing protein